MRSGRILRAIVLFLALTLPCSAQPHILTQIPMPGFSSIWGVAVNPNTNRVYATLPSRNEVVVIDGVSNSIIGTVPVGESPLGVAVNPNTNRIYVANQNTRSLSVIDGETNAVVATLPMTVEHQGSTFTFPPMQVAVNPATDRIYVTRAGGGFPFAIIDGATNTVVGTFVANAFDVAVNPVTNRIYATEFLGSQRIGVFDGETDTQITRIFVGQAPLWIAANPSTNRVYTANEHTSNVSVIDGTTDSVIATIDVPDFPVTPAVNPISNRLYVASLSFGGFAIVNGSDDSLVAQLLLGQTRGIGVNTVTSRIYVGVTGSGHMAVIEDITNRPPVAEAGADQTIHCASAGATPVTLDGSGSSDPDGDALHYGWKDANGNVVGTEAVVNLSLPLGSHAFTLTVSDGRGGTASDSVTVQVLVSVEGLLSPLAALVPEGEMVPLPSRAFRQGSTLPLRLTMSCGATLLTDADVAPPEIVALTRNDEPVDLETVDLDSGESNDSGTLFRFSEPNWVFNLSTSGLGPGTYAITLMLPDGRRVITGFVLR